MGGCGQNLAYDTDPCQALLMYDRLLTVERDVRLGWGRPVSTASALCWLMQLAVFIYLWMYMAMIMTESCKVSMFANIVCMVSLTRMPSGQPLLSFYYHSRG